MVSILRPFFVYFLLTRFFSILSSSPISPEIYSWGRRLLATNLGRLRALVSFPRTAIAIEMEEAWGPMSECSYRAIKTPEQLCRVEQLSLPEFRKQFLSHTDTGCKCKTFLVPQIDNHYNKRPLPRKDVKYGRRMPKDPSSLAAAQFEVDLPSKGMCRPHILPLSCTDFLQLLRETGLWLMRHSPLNVHVFSAATRHHSRSPGRDQHLSTTVDSTLSYGNDIVNHPQTIMQKFSTRMIVARINPAGSSSLSAQHPYGVRDSSSNVAFSFPIFFSSHFNLIRIKLTRHLSSARQPFTD